MAKLMQNVIVVVGLFMTSNALAQSVHGVFKVVKGEVLVTSKSGKVERAKLGMKVFPKDKIKTQKDARAKVVMVDNNELNITPDTEVIIEDYKFNPEQNKKSVILNVMYGKIRAKVEQKYDDDNRFQVKTKSAVAGVRGTDFFTSYTPSNNETKVVTFEGRVEFGVPGENGTIKNAVFIGAGQTSALTKGEAPSRPTEIPKSELSRMNDASRSEERAPANIPDSGGFSMMKEGDLAGGEEAQVSAELPPPPPPDVRMTNELQPNKSICDINPGLCSGNRSLIIDVTNSP